MATTATSSARSLFCAAAILVASHGFAGNAHAWGAEGHEAVCEIAFQELTETAKAKVLAIMATETDSRFKTLRQGCGWPDHRGSIQTVRRPEHYVNVPRHWYEIRGATCWEADTCLFTAIEKDAAVLRDPNATPKEKLTAIKFLGHWIGDIHQPLHVSYRDDRGGNDILLESGIGCKKKLHDVWDNCIPEDHMKEMGAADREQYGKMLHAEITDAMRSEWSAETSALAWANESYQITRDPEALYCFLNGTACAYDHDRAEYVPDETADNEGKRTIRITSSYEDRWSATAKSRIQQAGVRFGALLNSIFD